MVGGVSASTGGGIRRIGVDIEEYAARRLFAPLGITDWHWKRTPGHTSK
jgi:CubicO group peptidase (beta-lactamase class C family)